MECTLAALIACFSWSGLFIDTDLTILDQIAPRQEWRTTVIQTDSVVETFGRYITTDQPRNPYGRVSIGYGIAFKSISVSLEASHTSSLATDKDRGSNGISLRARWYPFR